MYTHAYKHILAPEHQKLRISYMLGETVCSCAGAHSAKCIFLAEKTFTRSQMYWRAQHERVFHVHFHIRFGCARSRRCEYRARDVTYAIMARTVKKCEKRRLDVT